MNEWGWTQTLSRDAKQTLCTHSRSHSDPRTGNMNTKTFPPMPWQSSGWKRKRLGQDVKKQSIHFYRTKSSLRGLSLTMIRFANKEGKEKKKRSVCLLALLKRFIRLDHILRFPPRWRAQTKDRRSHLEDKGKMRWTDKLRDEAIRRCWEGETVRQEIRAWKKNHGENKDARWKRCRLAQKSISVSEILFLQRCDHRIPYVQMCGYSKIISRSTPTEQEVMKKCKKILMN